MSLPSRRRPLVPRHGGAALLALALTAAPASAARVPTAKTPAASAPTTAADRFSFQGLGRVVAGQDLAQAEAALGQPLTPEPAAARPTSAASRPAAGANTGCQYFGHAGHPGVRYALAGGVLTRIETRDARYATLSGIHVGDSLARARQVYGRRLAEAVHPYFDKGRMLSVHSPDRRFALVMESNDDGRIITLRSGRLPEVGWLEACS